MNQTLLLFGLFLGVFATLGLGVFAFAGDGSGKKAARRLETIRDRHSTSREVMAQAQMKRIVSMRRDNKFDDLLRNFIPRPAELRLRLERTGKSWTTTNFAVACAAIAVVTLVALWAAGAPFLAALFTGLFLGLAVPHQTVNFLLNRRVKAFTSKFPDAIDLLVRGLKAGLPISESLGVVGRELPDPVGMEFRSVADKIRIGRTMEQALTEMATRIGTAEFNFFVITLAIQRETGGNLAETLNGLGEVLRKRAQMKLKVNAMASESKASAYIVGSLPFCVFGLVWMANAAYLMPFFTDTRLMIAGMGGAVWMSIGVFAMAKMISFEI